MDKSNNEVFNHSINITQRKNLLVSGVKKINSFDELEFFIETIMGHVLIKGEDLELLKLDTFQGNLSIKGKINSVIYLESNNKKAKAERIISRLFK